MTVNFTIEANVAWFIEGDLRNGSFSFFVSTYVEASWLRERIDIMIVRILIGKENGGSFGNDNEVLTGGGGLPFPEILPRYLPIGTLLIFSLARGMVPVIEPTLACRLVTEMMKNIRITFISDSELSLLAR